MPVMELTIKIQWLKFVSKSRNKTTPKLIIVIVEMKEYEILYDTGEARKLVAQINRMAKEGWQAKSIGALGAPTGVRAVYVLMERESE